jgi:hypothetical protein
MSKRSTPESFDQETNKRHMNESMTNVKFESWCERCTEEELDEYLSKQTDNYLKSLCQHMSIVKDVFDSGAGLMHKAHLRISTILNARHNSSHYTDLPRPRTTCHTAELGADGALGFTGDAALNGSWDDVGSESSGEDGVQRFGVNHTDEEKEPLIQRQQDMANRIATGDVNILRWGEMEVSIDGPVSDEYVHEHSSPMDSSLLKRKNSWRKEHPRDSPKRRVNQVSDQIKIEADIESVDNSVMSVVLSCSEANAQDSIPETKGKCLGYNCGEMLTVDDKDHALCNICWDKTFNDDADFLARHPGQAQRESEIRLECERYRVASFPPLSVCERACGNTDRKIVDFPVPPTNLRRRGTRQLMAQLEEHPHPEARIEMKVENVRTGEEFYCLYSEPCAVRTPDWYYKLAAGVADLYLMNLASNGDIWKDGEFEQVSRLKPGTYAVTVLRSGTESSLFRDPSTYIRPQSVVKDFRPYNLSTTRATTFYIFDGSTWHPFGLEGGLEALLLAKNARVRELEAEKADLRGDLKWSNYITRLETQHVCDVLENQCFDCEKRWAAQGTDSGIIVEYHIITADLDLTGEPEVNDRVEYAQEFNTVSVAKWTVSEKWSKHDHQKANDGEVFYYVIWDGNQQKTIQIGSWGEAGTFVWVKDPIFIKARLTALKFEAQTKCMAWSSATDDAIADMYTLRGCPEIEEWHPALRSPTYAF